MPSLKSEQESPSFSSLLGILSLRVLDFEHLMPVEVVNGQAVYLQDGDGENVFIKWVFKLQVF